MFSQKAKRSHIAHRTFHVPLDIATCHMPRRQSIKYIRLAESQTTNQIVTLINRLRIIRGIFRQAIIHAPIILQRVPAALHSKCTVQSFGVCSLSNDKTQARDCFVVPDDRALTWCRPSERHVVESLRPTLRPSRETEHLHADLFTQTYTGGLVGRAKAISSLNRTFAAC